MEVTKSNFRKLFDHCEESGDKIGDVLLDTERTSVELYKTFLDLAMPAIALKTFKESMIIDKLANNVTSSEEAFGILVFENNFDRWKWQAQQEQIKKSGGVVSLMEAPDVLYQQKVKKRRDDRDTAGKWLQSGVERFNSLLAKIRDIRKVRGEFEERLFTLYGEEEEQLDTIFRKPKRKELEVEVNSPNKKKKVLALNVLNIETV